VKIIDLGENTRFTGGNAPGLKASDGEFVARVNNDTHADDRWLENLIRAMLEDSTVGIWPSKLLFEQVE
jgi:GT2 family glycosyltransferase